jgi:DNA adenine methylase
VNRVRFTLGRSAGASRKNRANTAGWGFTGKSLHLPSALLCTSGPAFPKGRIKAKDNPETLHPSFMRGPLAYIGGKCGIAKKIIEVFPKHTTYVEPFAGGAQVFFRKEPSEVEVLNDLDGEMMNFFRVCQQHYEELLRYLRFVVVSRKWHELLKATDPATLTDIQRAARHLYLLKNCYAGLIRNLNYKCCVVQPPGFNPETLPAIIEETHKRLARVQLENLPYENILRRFDRSGTLFYLDPPYFGLKLYRHNLTTADFEKMAERLEGLKAKFVLSLNDVPEVRRIFKPFKFREIELAYTAQKIAGRRYREVLITNF